MGYTPSTPKVTLEAYLTQLGRYYLVYSGTSEQISINYFGLGDPDANYEVASNDIGGGEKNILTSGFVPDLSGDHDCIKSLAVEKQRYILNNPIDNTNNNNFTKFDSL